MDSSAVSMNEQQEIMALREKLHELSNVVHAHGLDIAMVKQESTHARGDFKVRLDQLQSDISHGLGRVTAELRDLVGIACTREMLESSNLLTQSKLDTVGAKVDVLLKAAGWVIATVLGSVILAVMALIIIK